MDKTSLNYANLFGYQEALGLQKTQFNYLSASMLCSALYSCSEGLLSLRHFVYACGRLLFAAVVYAGYFFGQYPCGWLIGRYPAQRIMAASVLLWGVTVLIMTQARSYSSACEYQIQGLGKGSTRSD